MIWTLLLLAFQAQANPPKTASPKTEAAKAAPAAAPVSIFAKPTPPAIRSYNIRVWLSIDDHPRLPESLKAAIERELYDSASRYLGGAWELAVVPAPAGLAESPDVPGEDLPDAKLLLPPRGETLDKIMWVRVSVARDRGPVPPYTVAAREYDLEFKSWGAAATRALEPDDSLPAAVFALVHRQFRAQVQVVDIAEGENRPKHRVQIAVRGLALQPADTAFPLIQVGSPIKLVREIKQRAVTVGVVGIPWTYLIFRTIDDERMTARCDIISAYPLPISRGMLRRSRVTGLEVSTAVDAATEIRFFARDPNAKLASSDEKRSVVGYEVVLRQQDQPVVTVVGNTDRRGRVVIRPAALGLVDHSGDVRPRVCEVTLRIGRIPVVSFPVVPGDETQLEVPARPDPLLPEINGKIAALLEEIVDALAQQALLEKRFERRRKAAEAKQAKREALTKAEQAELDDLAAKLNNLPKNEHFTERLTKIHDEALAKLRALLKSEAARLSSAVEKLFRGVEHLLKTRTIGREIVKEKTVETAPAKPAGKG